MGLFDTHAHLDDSRFDEDRISLINDLKKRGVDLVVNVGADMDSSLSSLKLAKEYDFIYAAVGIHPHDSRLFGDEDIKELKKLAVDDKVVAIGEIGLDYYYDNSPREVQKELFRKQIVLANELNLPFIIHSRDAVADTFDIVKYTNKNSAFVLHSYNQSIEMTKKYLELGGYFSISGPITFKNAKAMREVVKFIPMNRLFLETDCPYLTPEPFRGRRNEPSLTRFVAQEIGKIKGLDTEEVIEVTTKNAKMFFGIK